MSRFVARASLAVIFVALAGALPAQQTKPSQFIVTKGKDTVAVEVFTRDASSLSSEIYQSVGVRTQYTANLRPDASVQQLEMTRQGRQGGVMGITVNIGDTLVTASATAGGEQQKLDFVTHGRATPFLAVSFALCEQIVQASHLAAGSSMKWTVVRLGAGDSASLVVTRFHADSVSLVTSDVEIRLAVSNSGEVTGGRHVGQNWLIQRKTPGK